MALTYEEKFALKTASLQAVATLLAGRNDDNLETYARRAEELYRYLLNAGSKKSPAAWRGSFVPARRVADQPPTFGAGWSGGQPGSWHHTPRACRGKCKPATPAA